MFPCTFFHCKHEHVIFLSLPNTHVNPQGGALANRTCTSLGVFPEPLGQPYPPSLSAFERSLRPVPRSFLPARDMALILHSESNCRRRGVASPISKGRSLDLGCVTLSWKLRTALQARHHHCRKCSAHFEMWYLSILAHPVHADLPFTLCFEVTSVFPAGGVSVWLFDLPKMMRHLLGF